MAAFKYEGITADGTQVQGVVEALNQFDALEKARSFCSVVQSIKRVQEKSSFLSMEIGNAQIKPNEIAIMCQQFATVINSGLGIAQCVSLVGDQTSNKNLKKILAEVTKQVASGHTLATSFETEGGNKLPAIFYETIRSGELAGSLDQSFLMLGSYFEKRSKTRAQLVQALTYPSFVIVLAIAVVAIMMIFVVPTFKDILQSYGSNMPAMTAALISVSDFFGTWWILILAIIVAAVIGFMVWKKSEKGREKWAEIKLSVPVLGPITQYKNAAQFANTMALLLSSGLHITTAMNTTSKVIDNYVFSKSLEKAAVGLEEGRSLGNCLGNVKYMPRPLIEMAVVGEETGSLEESLQNMGAFYDEETQRATTKAISRLEPAVLIFIALFAGYIVIALYLAMFSIYGSM